MLILDDVCMEPESFEVRIKNDSDRQEGRAEAAPVKGLQRLPHKSPIYTWRSRDTGGVEIAQVQTCILLPQRNLIVILQQIIGRAHAY